MKKSEIITLKNGIERALALENTSVKFRYGLLRNRDYVLPEFKRLQEIEEGFSAEIKEFLNEKDKLIQKVGERNEQGNIVVYATNKEAFEKYTKGLKPLEAKYKKQLDEYNSKMEEYQKTVLNEELEETPKVYEISIDCVPDFIATDILYILTTYKIIK